MADTMQPVYLIAGGDEAKTEAARSRLRARAEREGGLVSFEPPDSRKGPDAELIAGELAMLSLAPERRYVIADGVERWKKADVERIETALAQIAPETTLVLVARGTAPKALVPVVEAAGGAVLDYRAPDARQLPRWAVGAAQERGFRLEPEAARILVERRGARQLRLAAELDRLALWAGQGGTVTAADLEETVTGSGETVAWALADAVVARDRPQAIAIADRLVAQGESVAGLVGQLASRLRLAHQAAEGLAAGRSASQVQGELAMHPYAAKLLVAAVRGTDPRSLRRSIRAIAELEAWTRGDADYDEPTAVVMALGRATG